MIVLSKDCILEDYFIDQNAVITDKNGNIQKYKMYGGRTYFKNIPIHRIVMYTFYGYRDGHKWNIHHIDENKLNNSLSNLVYLTREEHSRLHQKAKKKSEETKYKMSLANKGKKLSEETKQKLSAVLKGKKNHLGKYHSTEAKQKMSAAKKGKKFFNNGIKNIRAKECPEGFTAGIIKKKKLKKV